MKKIRVCARYGKDRNGALGPSGENSLGLGYTGALGSEGDGWRGIRRPQSLDAGGVYLVRDQGAFLAISPHLSLEAEPSLGMGFKWVTVAKTG